MYVCFVFVFSVQKLPPENRKKIKFSCTHTEICLKNEMRDQNKIKNDHFVRKETEKNALNYLS